MNEKILERLNQPLWGEGAFTVWMALAAGLVLLLVLLVLVVMIRKKKKKGKQKEEKLESKDTQTVTATVKEQPSALPVLDVANLQGIGSREEQQDAFSLSRIDEYEQQGLLAFLCDGMGGMAEGGRIAGQTATELLSVFPWEEDSIVENKIQEITASVYRQFRGHGGTTLVAVLLKQNQLSFWCVGDSDLFLLREGKLYSLNVRQEYKNELALRALEGAFPIEEAYLDPQAGALSEYIGKEQVHCDCTHIPISLEPEDTLLLCSDGVSDTLTLRQIRESMTMTPQKCCEQLEQAILEAAKPNQDNYTAIVIRYNGNGGE